MAQAKLTIDLGAIARNWAALARLAEGSETAAVVKADAYGLGMDRAAPVLAQAGARHFYVAQPEEGVKLRAILGAGPQIFVFGGHMAGDAPHLADADLIALLNSPEQVARHQSALPQASYGVQLDTGMNRLGMEAKDWAALRGDLDPVLVMSHLACADEPSHPQNAAQLSAFQAMTQGVTAPRSLAATGGTLLGGNYHFDSVRPGIGTYGGFPFEAAEAVVSLSLPVIQTRWIEPGETVGYGATFVADAPRRIATVSSGYADGLIRAMGPKGKLWAGDVACPLAGRVSMDLMSVDVTHLTDMPDHLDILSAYQSIDQLAQITGTIGYEILTSLGARYDRSYRSP
ncbi:MAG: alanine racemase [Pseudomonadota bacterium]